MEAVLPAGMDGANREGSENGTAGVVDAERVVGKGPLAAAATAGTTVKTAPVVGRQPGTVGGVGGAKIATFAAAVATTGAGLCGGGAAIAICGRSGVRAPAVDAAERGIGVADGPMATGGAGSDGGGTALPGKGARTRGAAVADAERGICATNCPLAAGVASFSGGGTNGAGFLHREEDSTRVLLRLVKVHR